MLKKAAASIFAVGVLSTGLLVGAAGSASAATYTGGCSRVVIDTGSTGWQAAAGPASWPLNCWSIYGHIQMWGPGFSMNGPTANGPNAFKQGYGSGQICARLWENHGGGHYTDRGTACGWV